MHTGDNMLAIYASEKALRLAERLEEAAAASRAHGIFGRVFGRIGDTERARENLERSVELARDSDPSEAIRALLALGYHFEIAEADYDSASEAYHEALGIAERIGDLPSQVELHFSLSLLAFHAASGTRSSTGTETVAALVEREGLTGKLCFPHLLRGALRWRDGDSRGLRALASARSRSGGAGGPLGDRVPGAPRRSRRRFATASPTRTPTASSPPHSTRASAPDSSRSRSKRPPPARSTRRSGAGPTQATLARRRGHGPRRAPALPGRLRRGTRGARARSRRRRRLREAAERGAICAARPRRSGRPLAETA